MKVSFNWLKDYVDIELAAADIAGRLTMAGLEVKAMVATGEWGNILVGRIIEINPHPNADRIRLATVDLGTGAETVVCGAPNIAVGDRIAFARPGAELIDGRTGQKFRLKPARIRGVDSAGMICSERELGISASHEGIMVLPAGAPVGVPLASYLGEVVFDLEVTPNRPDCLSVIGIAREVAAVTAKHPHIPDTGYQEGPQPIQEAVSVEIRAPDLCPRYCAGLVTGVKVKSSPEWMQARLLASGMRPINNVVDVTNYVMLEYGQPLHAFDYERLTGKKIVVRRAGAGEKMVSLDGVERTLSPDTLVIADEARPVAIAGVMGGISTEVTEGTTSVLLESASFKPTSIYYTSRSLALGSEASIRFERGIRADLTIPALNRAIQLLLQVAGGQASGGMIDVYPGRQERKPIKISPRAVERLLGIKFSVNDIAGALKSLGFECQITDLEVAATAPYWRGDVNIPVDLVEEVARVSGYDRIPSTLLGQKIPRQDPNPRPRLRQNVGRALAGYGFQEVVTYSLVGSDLLSRSGNAAPCLRVSNPMTADQEYLRPALRPGLLAAIAANLRHEDGGIRLFEIGKVFVPRAGGLPLEREMACGVLTGPRSDKSWHGGERPLDFYDVKGTVEGVLEQLGLAATFAGSRDEGLAPGRQASIFIEGKEIGVTGGLHPGISAAFEFPSPVYLFELDLDALLPLASGLRMFQPIPRFPPVVRDIALVLDMGIAHQQVLDVIRGFPLVSAASVFDVYSGEQVPAGRKSMAYRITFQSPDHTLTDEEADSVQAQILERLATQLGAILRS